MRSLGLLFTCALMAGCVSSLAPSAGLRARLSGRGPVPLTENPYLVGNLELAREMARSPVLRGFISHRGTPTAIEVQKSSFGSAQLVLYYAAEHEQFNFEESAAGGIVEGPTPIGASTAAKVAAIAQPGIGKAPLLSKDSLSATLGEEFPDDTPMVPPTARPPRPPPVLPTPTPEERTPSGTTSGDLPIAPHFETSDKTTGSALSDGAIAANLAAKEAHPAEITAKGDLVHYVTLPGETLSIIARWYTFDRNNAGRLARINGIKDPGTVSVGDIVVVPAYLVRNKNRLSVQAVELLARSSAATPAESKNEQSK